MADRVIGKLMMLFCMVASGVKKKKRMRKIIRDARGLEEEEIAREIGGCQVDPSTNSSACIVL